MTKDQEMQRFIRFYREKTSKDEWDMHEVAKMASEMGWKLPIAPSPVDLLARAFSKAARSETRIDNETGQRYRVNHAFTADDKGQVTLWVDIDTAPRKHMQKSVTNRREQVVGDLVQLTFDVEHWNRVNPTVEPLDVPLDFTFDVEWRKNGGDAGEEAA